MDTRKNTKNQNTTNKMRRPNAKQALVGLLCLAPLWLAGCGGGGGGYATPPVKVLSGSVRMADGTPLAGYRVVYDPASDLAPGQGVGSMATTDGQGRFTLSVLPSQVTGHDTVAIYDTTDSLVTTAAVVPGDPEVIITVTPPVPPAPPASPA